MLTFLRLGYNWNGSDLIWVPDFFGLQEIWSPRYLGPDKFGPAWNSSYGILGAKKRSGTISVIASDYLWREIWCLFTMTFWEKVDFLSMYYKKKFINNYLSFVGYPLSSQLVRKVAPPSFLHFVGGRKSNSASSTGPPLTPENWASY